MTSPVSTGAAAGASDVLRPGVLAGLSCIVTGAGTGIGRAISLRLCALGAQVSGIGRRAEPLHSVAAEAGAAFTAFPCDIRDREAAASLVADIGEVAGIDVLVNNAGGAVYVPGRGNLGKRLGRGDRPQPDGAVLADPGRVPFPVPTWGERDQHVDHPCRDGRARACAFGRRPRRRFGAYAHPGAGMGGSEHSSELRRAGDRGDRGLSRKTIPSKRATGCPRAVRSPGTPRRGRLPNWLRFWPARRRR